MPGDRGAAAARAGRPEKFGVKTVPSVGETVQTCAWLGEALKRDLQQDVESDDAQGQALREADIDLSSLLVLPNRELLHSKIREALICWDKLAQRMPLKRQRPEGLVGRMAGSEDMYLDFDIDEATVPLEPPQGVSDVQLYQYYVQRIMSAVPRADSLENRTTEGPVPLRTYRVKNAVDAVRTRPYGDVHLLKETNYLCEEKSDRVAEEAFSRTAAAGEVSSSRDRVADKASSDGAAAATTGAALSGQRIFQSFSGPSRAVVTFAVYRSAAKGKGLRLPGHLPEKRLFEVEALEHNTLQQIMEVMPPCLTDRIMEERRQGRCGDAQGRVLTPPPEPRSSRQQGLGLAGGFVFIRGVFYVTRPTAGEDVSDVPPPPPPPAPEPHTEGRRHRQKGGGGKTPAGLRQKKGRGKGKKTSAAATDRGGGQSKETREEEEARVAAAAEADAAAAAAAAPPEPWMNRWLQAGGGSWDADKEDLMKEAEGRRHHPGGEEEDGREKEPRGAVAARSTRGGGASTPSGGGKGQGRGEGGGDREGGEEAAASRVTQRPAARGARTGNATGQKGPAGKDKGPQEEEEEEEEENSEAAAPRKRRRGDEDGGGKGKGKQAKSGGRSAVGGAAAGNGRENGALAGDREEEEEEDGEGEKGRKGKGKGNRVYARGQLATFRRPGQTKKAVGKEDKLIVSEQGQTMRRRLELKASGRGKVVWASDATVADLRPVLGERYVFLHHRDCDHLFVVSDIRIEPVLVPPPEPEPAVAVDTSGEPAAAAMATREENAGDSGSASTAKQQQQQQQQQQAGSSSSTATRGAADTDSVHPGGADRGGGVRAAASTGGVSTENTAAAVGDGDGSEEGKEEQYPRLSFLSNPNCRRCGVCLTKTAVKMSVGHPLSDKAYLFCCQACFEMLHLDADQKPLEGELAGDVATTFPPGDTTSPSPSQGREAGQVAGGPKGWRVFRCYDEH